MTSLPRYSPDIERAVQADIRPRLLAAIEVVKRAMETKQEKTNA